MSGIKNKFLAVALTLLSIVGYGVVAFSYGQLADGTDPDITNGYNVHEFILDPGCAPGEDGCFKNTSYWELATNNEDIYFTSANVGVGIDTPTYKFHVEGDTKTAYTGTGNEVFNIIGDLSADPSLAGFGMDEGAVSLVLDDSGSPTTWAFSRVDYNSGSPLFAFSTRYSDGAITNFDLKKTGGVPLIQLKTTLASTGETSTFALTGNTSGEPQTTLVNTYVNGGSGSFNILPINDEPRVALQSLLSSSASSYLTLAGDTSGEPEVTLQATFSNGNYGAFDIINDNGEPNPRMLVVDAVNDSAAGIMIVNNTSDESDDFSLYSQFPGVFGVVQDSVASIYSTTTNGEKEVGMQMTNSEGELGGISISTNAAGNPEINLSIPSVGGVEGYLRIGDDGTGEPIPTLQTVNTNTDLAYGLTSFSDNATFYRCNSSYPSVVADCFDDRVIKIDDTMILTDFWNSVTTDSTDKVSTGQQVNDTGVDVYFERVAPGSSGTGQELSFKVGESNNTSGEYGLFFDTGGLEPFIVRTDGTIYSDVLDNAGCPLEASAGREIVCGVSDRRLKKDIQESTYGLDEVLELRPVTYYLKDKDKFGSERQLGLIAQEVENVIPEVVVKGGDYYSLKYGNLTPLLITAIQELNLKIDEIEPMSFENDTFVESLRNWFSDRANQLASIFVKKAYVEELCIGTEGDETCLTKDQIDQLLLQNNVTENDSDNNDDDSNDTDDSDNNDDSNSDDTSDDTTDDTSDDVVDDTTDDITDDTGETDNVDNEDVVADDTETEDDTIGDDTTEDIESDTDSEDETTTDDVSNDSSEDSSSDDAAADDSGNESSTE